MSEPTWKELDDSRRGLYVAYLEDLGRIGGRHETVRQFYFSILTALSGLLVLVGQGGVFEKIKAEFLVVVAIVGIIICGAWFLHMFSFGTLFHAKRATLQKLEADLLLKPFGIEQTVRSKWYIRLTIVDRLAAAAFFALFVALLNAKLPPVT